MTPEVVLVVLLLLLLLVLVLVEVLPVAVPTDRLGKRRIHSPASPVAAAVPATLMHGDPPQTDDSMIRNVVPVAALCCNAAVGGQRLPKEEPPAETPSSVRMSSAAGCP